MQSLDLPLSSLKVSKLNTRKNLKAGQEDSGVRELATSIQKQGLLQPLVVRPADDGTYEVVSGQRRLHACKLIEKDPVPCLVREDLEDTDAKVVSLVENVHRADMDPLDKARALKDLYEQLGTYKRVSEETGWSPSTVSKYVSLLSLPAELQERLGTSEDSAQTGTLSRLAKTYSEDEAIEVYEEIAGFNQRVQKEIISRSDGDAAKVPEIAAEAREGIFDTRRCGGAYGCEIVKEIMQGKLGEDAFEQLVAMAAEDVEADAEDEELKQAAREFWKALALW